MKKIIKKIPIMNTIATKIYRRIKFGEPFHFQGSEIYWEQRYAKGGNSGVGSYNKFATFKAAIINKFVSDHNITSIIEFGCGDGNQLELNNYPNYLGLDVSENAISRCRTKFLYDKTKNFMLMKEYSGERANLALSIDVIYHLVEDSIYEDYMVTLFNASDRFVIIYSSNSDENRMHEGSHIKHRKFTSWIAANQNGR
jgi:hypothetical protein